MSCQLHIMMRKTKAKDVALRNLTLGLLWVPGVCQQGSMCTISPAEQLLAQLLLPTATGASALGWVSTRLGTKLGSC